MDNYEDDVADEWMANMADETEDLRERDSNFLTWDDELVRESHRKVAIRALRASADWRDGGIFFRWSGRNVA